MMMTPAVSCMLYIPGSGIGARAHAHVKVKVELVRHIISTPAAFQT